ncbi:MAG: FHA domain-containing protein [Planctomycetota bacterium]
MSVLYDKVTSRQVVLDRSPIRLGRFQDNDVVVRAREVSRHHCELRRDLFGRWVIRQLGSSMATEAGFNCTFVKRGGRIIRVMAGERPLKLENWDEIALGQKHAGELDFRFEYCVDPMQLQEEETKVEEAT